MDIMQEMLTRLQQGEKVETLAQELTDAINDANAQFQKEQAAKQVGNKKVAAADNLIRACAELARAYNLSDEDVNEILTFRGEDLVAFIDEIAGYVQEYTEIRSAIAEKRLRSVLAAKQAKAKPLAGDPLEDFLDKYVR